jgi:hypothetical protein
VMQMDGLLCIGLHDLEGIDNLFIACKDICKLF